MSASCYREWKGENGRVYHVAEPENVSPEDVAVDEVVLELTAGLDVSCEADTTLAVVVVCWICTAATIFSPVAEDADANAEATNEAVDDDG